MIDRVEDDIQEKWCTGWSEQHRQKKRRRIHHWCNCKLYIKYAWYELREIIRDLTHQ